MKGMVFCEFIEMVDDTISPEMSEKIIEKADLPSGGVYTSVGTYDHKEIVSLVVALSEETGVPIPKLVNTFGNYLFGRFVETHGHFFENATSCFGFLERVDDYIHVEVLKLYPDAQLPKISTQRPADNELELIYTSSREMGDLAEGLIQACIKHFKEDISLSRQGLPDTSEGQVIKFQLLKNS